MKLLYISGIFTACVVAQMMVLSFLTSCKINCSACYLLRFTASVCYGCKNDRTPFEHFGVPSLQAYTVTATSYSKEGQTCWYNRILLVPPSGYNSPQRARASSSLGLCNLPQPHHTLQDSSGRVISLRRDLYRPTHDTRKIQTPMNPGGLETTILESKRTQTNAATEVGRIYLFT